jgi:DNA modification methylase
VETLRIEYQPIESAKLAKNNPKAHDLPTIKASIVRWGFSELPVLNERTGRLVAGHGRREALIEIRAGGGEPPGNIRVDESGAWCWPVLRGVTFASQAEADAYLVAVNNTTIRGGWDTARLAQLLESVRSKGLELTGTGYTTRELDRMLSKHGTGGEVTEPPEPPEPPKDPVTKPGDSWQLGDHVITCGDCRDPNVIRRLMGGATAEMLMADPPYGMGKEADGVIGDNQYGQKLDAFQRAWWEAVRPSLEATAACYIWGNAPDLWRFWWGWLSHTEDLTFRNELVWDKAYGNGQGVASHLQYPTLTERCLFFALGKQGFGSRNKDRYWEGWEPLRLYLVEEAKRLGLTSKQVGQITGTTNMWQHWSTRSQWSMITREGYLALQQATGGFPRTWDQIKDEYDRLRAEFNVYLGGERAYHDNTHETMGDVWSYPRVRGDERHGHATPKPVLMMARAIRTSCRRLGVVLSPFGGTGPELLAAEQTGRMARLVELQPGYVDVVVERWQQLSGGKAQLIRG